MVAIASQIASLTIVYSTVYLMQRSKKTSKLRVPGLCAGNSTVTDGFPAPRASNAKNVSIWWRQNVMTDFSDTSIKIIYTIQFTCFYGSGFIKFMLLAIFEKYLIFFINSLITGISKRKTFYKLSLNIIDNSMVWNLTNSAEIFRKLQLDTFS